MGPSFYRENTIDQEIWSSVVDQNEYRLPESLPEDGLIVDVGAHIGGFTYACWSRGARRIFAFEADRANFDLLQSNCDLRGVTLINAAVTRSDLQEEFVYHRGYTPFDEHRINTGSGDVFGGVDHQMVRANLFDNIAPARPIALLKLDCEGSEWPILYTSNTLDRVQSIVGEYHTLPSYIEHKLNLGLACDASSLRRFLYAVGFGAVEVTEPGGVHHEDQQVGKFFASRTKAS
jgi:FkbM family methyltransferase